MAHSLVGLCDCSTKTNRGSKGKASNIRMPLLMFEMNLIFIRYLTIWKPGPPSELGYWVELTYLCYF